MQLINVLSSVVLPRIPASISNRIEQATYSELSELEIQAFTVAYLNLAKFAKGNPFTYGINCLVIYTADNTIHIKPIPNSFGIMIPIAIIKLDKIRTANRNIDFLRCILALLEELCHALYSIRNEYTVKVRIHQILKDQFPDRTLHSYWGDVFDDNDRPIRNAYPEDYDDFALHSP